VSQVNHNPTLQPGEILAMSLLRLPQLVKLHQPNNKIFVEYISEFRKILFELWAETPMIAVRFHRSRLYINEKRLAANRDLQMTITKLMEFIESRGFFGFYFSKVETLPDEDIISFFKILNQCHLHKDPGIWLAAQLEGRWATPIVEKDFKISVIMSEDGSGRIVRPLVWNSGVKTLAIKARKSYSRALAVITGLNEKLSNGEAVNISKTRRVVQDMVEGLFQNENLLLGLSTIRDYDDYTCTHCVNVAILSMCLGKRIGLGKVQIMTLGLSALFHDLGKVDIPVSLIRKTSKFSADEYAVVKNHPLYSVLRILRINSDHNLKSKLIISPYEHHLGIDLTGYPYSGRVTQLTLYGRIVAIADHYDALTSSRSYRPIPISPEQALDIMLQISGTELDSLLMKVFVNMIGVYPVGTLILLDSREVAMVAETPSGAEEGRPMCIILEFEGEEIRAAELINLTDKNRSGRFKRNIIRCFHPSEFGLNPSDILVN
jgi:HD-GYP domain-containing protein (c-di-GMP phosphodiesterase class II)